MKDWQKKKLEKIIKRYGKERALKALETVKEITEYLETHGHKRFWTNEEIEEAMEVSKKWQ